MDQRILNMNLFRMNLADNPFSCGPEELLADVVKKMQKEHIGCLFIVENDKPIGIFTERDYFMKIAGNESQFNSKKIKELMTPNPVCLHLKDTLSKALQYMNLGQFRHFPIIDDAGKLIKAMSIKDIVNFILSH